MFHDESLRAEAQVLYLLDMKLFCEQEERCGQFHLIFDILCKPGDRCDLLFYLNTLDLSSVLLETMLTACFPNRTDNSRENQAENLEPIKSYYTSGNVS